jgi:hypothetical protein
MFRVRKDHSHDKEMRNAILEQKQEQKQHQLRNRWFSPHP